MSLPPFDNTMFERLKVKVDKSMENLKGMGLATMKDHFSEAIKRAHEYFLDSKASPFETLVRNNHGAAIKCAVKLNMADKGIASIRPPNSAKEYNVPVSSGEMPKPSNLRRV